jgi:uncharacterized membrane protein
MIDDQLNDDEVASPHWDKSRMDAFSDGVFAIAITILVLEIKVPSDLNHLSRNLEHEWPAYLAYVTSFLTIGGVWIAHHRLHSRLRFIDATMVRLNLLLLMITAFLPFPTAILAEALRAPEDTAATAVVLYGATVLVIELVLQTLTRYVTSRPQLAEGQRAEPRAASGRGWLSPIVILYAAAICVGLAGFPKIAAAFYLVLAIPSVVLAGAHGRILRWSRVT